MGALFSDIKVELSTPRRHQPIDGIYFGNTICGRHPHIRRKYALLMFFFMQKKTFSLLWSHVELWKVC